MVSVLSELSASPLRNIQLTTVLPIDIVIKLYPDIPLHAETFYYYCLLTLFNSSSDFSHNFTRLISSHATSR